MSVTAQTIIADALREIGVCPQEDDPQAADAARALRILNRDIMDPWNAQRQFATGRVFTTGTFAASGQTRTIGPTGAGGFVLTTRPIALLAAARIDSNNLAYEIRIRDAAWWNALPMPLLATSIITDIYYDPSGPVNGTMYPYPIPSGTQSVRVETYSLLTQFSSITASADFAPGYESAVVNTLKELCCHAWRKKLPEGLEKMARESRAVIQILNNSLPLRTSTDAPSSCSGPIGSDSTGFKSREF